MEVEMAECPKCNAVMKIDGTKWTCWCGYQRDAIVKVPPIPEQLINAQKRIEELEEQNAHLQDIIEDLTLDINRSKNRGS